MLMVHSRQLVAAAAGAALLAMGGCHVESDKRGDGKNVNISTPFGGLHVRTNDGAVLESIGIAGYPGATLVKKGKDKDTGAADVDMHFGSFQLRVKAATYRTDDAIDKVEAFYRNDLKRYGDVIACRGNKPVGDPTRTMAGLTCENHNDHHISVDDTNGKSDLQLKAGSHSHQHIVSLKPDHDGTQLSLVVLDLPSGTGDDDSK
jgi:hypothetical protein